MRRALLFAFCAALCLAAAASPGPGPEAARAKKRYDESVAAAQLVYDKKLKAATSDLVRDLNGALKQALKAENLDRANEIRAMIDEAQASNEDDDDKVSIVAELAGEWQVFYCSNARRTYVIKADGSVDWTAPGSGRRGRLRNVNGDTVIEFGDDRLERWTYGGGRIWIEHYNPKGQYPKGPPTLIGVAARGRGSER